MILVLPYLVWAASVGGAEPEQSRSRAAPGVIRQYQLSTPGEKGSTAGQPATPDEKEAPDLPSLLSSATLRLEPSAATRAGTLRSGGTLVAGDGGPDAEPAVCSGLAMLSVVCCCLSTRAAALLCVYSWLAIQLEAILA